MTKAAFQASFSDFRLVKSRKIAQFVLEVPIEGADAALVALGGLPRPDQEAWVAVARIDPKAASEAPEPHKASLSALASTGATAALRRTWNDMSAVQQAGIRCGEKAFWRFLESLRGPELEGSIISANDAAFAVRSRCGIGSRKELLPDTPAEKRWQFIESAYQSWLASERYSEVAR